MSSEPLRVVLLGSTGFVGRAVLRVLAGTGRDVHVRALVRSEQAQLPAFARKVVGSLEHLPEGLFFAEPHVVVHLATKQFDRDGRGFGENAQHARSLLARLPESTRGIVYGSSASVYGQGGLHGVSESAPLAPETPLAQSRRDTEHVLLCGAEQSDRSLYILRPRIVIGAGDAHTLPGLARFFARGLTLSSGAQPLTVMHVDDYAEAILRLAERAQHERPVQRTLNAGYREPARFRDFAQLLGARPRLTIPASRRAYALLRRLPSPKFSALITRFELFGLSHHLDVSQLAELVGPDLIHKDPRAAIARARAELA
jgi:UDP-glucose 4-epimerase